MEKNEIHKKNHRTRSLQRDQTFRLVPNTFILMPDTTHVTDLESVFSCFFRVIAYESVWSQWLHLKGWHFLLRPDTTHVKDLESFLSRFFRVISYENVWAQWLHVKGWHFLLRPDTTHVTDLESVLSCFFRVIAYETVWAQWLHLKGWHFFLRPDTTHVTDLESWFRLIGGNFTTLPQVKMHLISQRKPWLLILF